MAPTSDLPDYEPWHVLEAKAGGYLVKSYSQEGVWWLVAGRDCSCPAGRAGNVACVHRVHVARLVRELNEKHQRPRLDDSSPAVTSRFVD